MPSKKNTDNEKKIILSVSMPESLKEDFQSTCKDLGFTVSGAITVFAKQMVQDQKFPFLPEIRKADT